MRLYEARKMKRWKGPEDKEMPHPFYKSLILEICAHYILTAKHTPTSHTHILTPSCIEILTP